MKLRVLVVSQQKMFRHSLAQYVRLLDVCLAMDVVSVDTSAAPEQIEAISPSLVLLDLSLRPGNALDITACIRRRWPSVAVVVVGNESEADYGAAALEAGALGYVDVLQLDTLVPIVTSLAERLGDCREGRAKSLETVAIDSPSAGPLENLLARLRTLPTGPRYGPYTAWQYVHLCLALILTLASLNLRYAPDIQPEQHVTFMVALLFIAGLEARQFTRARRLAQAVDLLTGNRVPLSLSSSLSRRKGAIARNGRNGST